MTTSRKLTPGLVSVILVNYRGAEDTVAAIKKLLLTSWPQERLEIVVVDNDSKDDSVKILEDSKLPFTLIKSATNLGFAAGCNLGVGSSNGEYVAFLNNDARPGTHWIKAAVAEFDRTPHAGAVASRVLDWAGKRVDYVGSAITWYGMGYKPGIGEPSVAVGNERKRVLFGTGAAMFVRRRVFDQLEGFDEDYFMFYEDVDFGWRLNLIGWQFVYAPDSVAYHKHHVSMAKLGSFKETYLLERNALFTLYKNIPDDRLTETLTAALMLSVRRAVVKANLDSTSFEVVKQNSDEQLVDFKLDKDLLANVYAIDQFTEALPDLERKRTAVQATRVVDDAEIWNLFGEVDAPILTSRNYREGYDRIVATFPVTQPRPRGRVMFLLGAWDAQLQDRVNERMLRIAQELSEIYEIKLVSVASADIRIPGLDVLAVRAADDPTFRTAVMWADLLYVHPEAECMLDPFAFLGKVCIIDMMFSQDTGSEVFDSSRIAGVHSRSLTDFSREPELKNANVIHVTTSSERERLTGLLESNRTLHKQSTRESAGSKSAVVALAEDTDDLAKLIATIFIARAPVHLGVSKVGWRKGAGRGSSLTHNLRRSAYFIRTHGVVEFLTKVTTRVFRRG